jgi:hypothetical protein
MTITRYGAGLTSLGLGLGLQFLSMFYALKEVNGDITAIEREMDGKFAAERPIQHWPMYVGLAGIGLATTGILIMPRNPRIRPRELEQTE